MTSDSPAAGNPASGITPETVPSEWLRAAWDADYAWLRSPDRERGGSWGGVPERQLRRVLAAAAPLIIARAGARLKDEIADEVTAICTETVLEAVAAEREHIRGVLGSSSSQCSRGVHVPWSAIERALGGDGNG